MRERGIHPQDCPRTVRLRRNRCGNTELACSPKYHGAKTAYWAVGRQLLPWDYFRIVQDPATLASERYCLFTAAVVQTVRPKQSLPRCSGRPHPVTNTSGIERQSLRG